MPDHETTFATDRERLLQDEVDALRGRAKEIQQGVEDRCADCPLRDLGCDNHCALLPVRRIVLGTNHVQA